MSPYYDHGGITIYHGDCRDILPGLGRFDLLLTDPPYGIGQAAWDAVLPIEWFGLALAALPATGAAYVFGDAITLSRFQVHWEEHGVQWGARIAWVYEDGPRNARAWTSKHEDCLYWAGAEHVPAIPKEPSIHRDPRWGNDRLMGDVWRVARVLGNYGERVGHETQKPTKLIQVPLAASCPPGGIVVDAFMGSGTTLRVAKELGRRAIGIELEERYCEIAAKRLAQEVLFA